MNCIFLENSLNIISFIIKNSKEAKSFAIFEKAFLDIDWVRGILKESAQSWWLIWFFAKHPNVFVDAINIFSLLMFLIFTLITILFLFFIFIRIMSFSFIFNIYFSKIMGLWIEIYFLFLVFNYFFCIHWSNFLESLWNIVIYVWVSFEFFINLL